MQEVADETAGKAQAQPVLQDLLFEGDFSPLPVDMGFRGPVAHRVAGITYRQLDYWARTGLVVPEIRKAGGSGTQRLYSFRDILLLRVVKRFLDVGISLQQIRVAIDHLRARGVEDLTEITLLSDGFSVYECTTANELFDLSKGGQGMFLISVSSVWKEIEGTLSALPSERAGFTVAQSATDELAARRGDRAI
ncbi:MAG: MerR family transcriptional regulator [Arachnia sp.]